MGRFHGFQLPVAGRLKGCGNGLGGFLGESDTGCRATQFRSQWASKAHCGGQLYEAEDQAFVDASSSFNDDEDAE
jgi:hypothetical protein